MISRKTKLAVCIVILILGTLYLIVVTRKLDSTHTGEAEGCDKAITTDCEELERLASLPPEELPTLPIPTTSANPVQYGQIDENLFVDNTLRDVELCERKYLAKQIIIDGVDVIQRIALIFKESDGQSTQEEEIICSNLELNPPIPKSGYNLSDPYELEVSEIILAGKPYYRIQIVNVVIDVQSLTGEIFLIDGYAGGYAGSIGYLK